MAEVCIVDDRHRFAIPDSLSDDSAAAMAIPGMSSWAALVERAHLRAGETVLVNGGTGTSGRLAIQIARHLGAKKVIATGRQTSAFDDLRLLGADVTVPLIQDRDALEDAFKNEFRQGVDIVLDYLWGMSAETLVIAAAKAGPEGVPIRYVQIGSISGPNINLPSAVLRSSALQLMGSGIGSVPFPRLLKAIQGVLEAAPSAGFEIATERVPLADVSRAWTAVDTASRIVLIP
jgi:NADPH:quinone reductase-like Zn-dependent oxidoreductase